MDIAFSHDIFAGGLFFDHFELEVSLLHRLNLEKAEANIVEIVSSS